MRESMEIGKAMKAEIIMQMNEFLFKYLLFIN